jgi:hypothetical protein
MCLNCAYHILGRIAASQSLLRVSPVSFRLRYRARSWRPPDERALGSNRARSRRLWKITREPDPFTHALSRDEVSETAVLMISETEPLPGVGDESPPSVPIIGCVMGVRLRLTANPSIRSCMDLLNSNGSGLLQMQVIDENQLMLCDQAERTPGAPLRGNAQDSAPGLRAGRRWNSGLRLWTT